MPKNTPLTCGFCGQLPQAHSESRQSDYGTRVVFCGGREWGDPAPVTAALMMLRSRHGDLIVVHGAARGADSVAGGVARSMGITVEEFPADWRGQGKDAGPIRNRLMLDQRPIAVYAFKDHLNWALNRGGTENMVRIALDAGVPVTVFDQGEFVRAERTSYGARPRAVEAADV